MNSKWLKLGALVTLVAILGALSVSAVSAQGPGNGMQPGGRGMRGGNMGGGMGMGANITMSDSSLMAIAAKTLGVTQTELVAALNSGKTIADVAKEKDVALDKIVDAVLAEHKTFLDQLVTAGRLTKEQVDARLALMKTEVQTRLTTAFNTRGLGFTDKNNDGICDNCGTTNTRPGMGMGGNMQPGGRGRWGR